MAGLIAALSIIAVLTVIVIIKYIKDPSVDNCIRFDGELSLLFALLLLTIMIFLR